MTLPRFPISFHDGSVAMGVRADQGTDLPRALRAMGLTTGVPAVVAVGAGSRPSQVSRLGPLLEKVVVAVAEAVEATVVDEGDPGGLGAALGQARVRRKAGFPLLGVAFDGTVSADLDPAHTHFVLVDAGHGAGRARAAPGAGSRARWIADVADALAGGNRSVALAVAGGEAAWDSLDAHVRAGRLVMAVGRTGGVADHLAAAIAGRPADGRAHALAGSGQVFAVDPARGAAHVADALRNALSRPDALGR